MMNSTKLRAIALSIPLVLGFVACSDSDSETKSSQAGGKMTAYSLPNTLQIEGETLGLKQNMKALGIKDTNLAMQTEPNPENVFGHSLAGEIKSLKYRISNMVLCNRSASSTGGDTCDGKAFIIYANNDGDYDSFVPPSEEAQNFTGWTDFMEKDSIKSLVGDVGYTEGHIGSYNSVVVNFFRTYRVNAEVVMNNGVTLYTKDSNEFYDNGKSGLDVTYATKITDITEGPSEEGLFFLPNGGKTFFLQKPFEITQSDIDNLVPYKMALAFDHNNFVKGASHYSGQFESASNDFVDGQVDDAAGYSLKTPFLEFAPILARESETIMRETYVFTTTGISGAGASLGEQPFNVRVTLYYVEEDPEKAIRAVTTQAYYSKNSTSYLNYNPLSGISSISDGDEAGTLVFKQGFGRSFTVLENFKRLSTVGETSTISGEICTGSFSDDGCAESPTPVSWVYSFAGSSEAETVMSIEAIEPVDETDENPESDTPSFR